MIVPEYWAEGQLQIELDGKQLTVRRFGWSDEGPLAAQMHADARTREAVERLQAGDQLPRRETKKAYNGASGMPIREQIVQREGDTLITRNSYGALCLNTPDVLFVDIDFDEEARFTTGKGSAWMLPLMAGLALGGVAGWLFSWSVAAIVLVVVTGLAYTLLAPRKASADATPEPVAGPLGPEEAARERIDRFVAQHPDWHLRLYRTPAGLRVLVMHRTFSSDEAAVADCFAMLGADKVYARMCRNQNCFRARLSPKPWRIGIDEHLKPSPGVWPVAPHRMAAREAWVARYEKAGQGHAACAFIEALGASTVHPSAGKVQRLHDEISRAESGLPTA